MDIIHIKNNIQYKIFKRNIVLSSSLFFTKRDKSVVYPKDLSDLDIININIYSGKINAKVRLFDKMIGFKLGAFVPTKITGEKVSYRKRMKDLLKRKKNNKKKFK